MTDGGDERLHGKSAVSAPGRDADGKSTLADETGTRQAPSNRTGAAVRRMTVSGTNSYGNDG